MPYISTENGRLTAEQKKQLIERLTATGDNPCVHQSSISAIKWGFR